MQEPQAWDLGLCRCEPARGGGLEPPMTGPEPVVLPITPPPKGGGHPSSRRSAARPAPAEALPHPAHPAVEADQAAEAHNAADSDLERLFPQVLQIGGAPDRRRPGWRYGGCPAEPRRQ